jgi:hypothetical protein
LGTPESTPEEAGYCSWGYSDPPVTPEGWKYVLPSGSGEMLNTKPNTHQGFFPRRFVLTGKMRYLLKRYYISIF